MATHRPIVSTSVPDVKRFYSDIVYLADTADEFIQQIAAAFDEPPHERARRHLREEKILAEQAWDAIADSMETLMQSAWSKTSAGKSQMAASRAMGASVRSAAPASIHQSGVRVPSYAEAAQLTPNGGE
jgi:hypothetical protein